MNSAAGHVIGQVVNVVTSPTSRKQPPTRSELVAALRHELEDARAEVTRQQRAFGNVSYWRGRVDALVDVLGRLGVEVATPHGR